MFIQTRDSEGDTTAYQDVVVSAPGTYRVALNYVARPGNFAGQTIKISFGPMSDGAITDDLINDQFTTTTYTELTPYEKYITVETVGTYRLLFTAFSSSTDYATAIDCVSVRRQTEYCFWTACFRRSTTSASRTRRPLCSPCPLTSLQARSISSALAR